MPATSRLGPAAEGAEVESGPTLRRLRINAYFKGVAEMKKDLEGNRSSARSFALTPSQQGIVDKLDEPALREIDAAILKNVSQDWRKVAMVVGLAMLELKNRVRGIPDVFYSQRVTVLAEQGSIEASGDLMQMQQCEVRLRSRQ
ncbi:DUF3658 domain-containing protein [Paraburkholderia domus]|uniref:DUF3658 domain-containing protein n=1 Tax=Paraburkholderia domus TaxID=2793075 RepID=UPI00191385AD|nr:DUF3658 domain-containing protein [Paraburkholderia domus]MBK5123330.1 hypothetical protein [Burkholderia sp. R-69980]MBK5162931.1 hypothetical protein [Burkholderia sp. R-70211]